MTSDGYGYQKGELEISEDHEYEPDPEHPAIKDANGQIIHLGRSRVVRTWPVAQLPHSCDEWLIGKAENVRALIADLRDALKKLEAKS